MKKITRKGILLMATASLLLNANAQKKGEYPIVWNGSFTTEAEGNFTNGEWNSTSLLFLNAEAKLWKGAKAQGGITGMYNLRLDQDKSWSVCDDRMMFSNLPYIKEPMLLSHLGIEQRLLDDKVMLFLGVRKADMDYFITPYSLLFLNTAVIINPVVSTVWGVPHYGTSALCFHAQWEFMPGFTVKYSLYNGQKSSCWDQMFYFRPNRDGVNQIAELSYKGDGCCSSYVGEYHLGMIYADSKYLDNYFASRVISNNDGKKHSGCSVFANVDQPLYVGKYPVGLMAQGGLTKKYVDNANAFYSLGLKMDNLMAEQSQVGVSLSRGYFADGVHESDFEITFSYPVMKNVAIQPGIHFISTSGERSTCALCRASINF